jgi:YD repeat-containing protein
VSALLPRRDYPRALTPATDALTHGTTYTYEASDRVAIRTDPLQRSAASFYDAKGLQTRTIDRRGQITQYQYDELDRLPQTTFGDGATTQYTYDLGDRVTQTVDSVSGTITRGYDGLDRLTAETTPEGSIGYLIPTPTVRPGHDGWPRVRIGWDPPGTHTFPWGGQPPHIQIDLWWDGVPGSTITLPRIPVPWYPWK